MSRKAAHGRTAVRRLAYLCRGVALTHVQRRGPRPVLRIGHDHRNVNDTRRRRGRNRGGEAERVVPGDGIAVRPVIEELLGRGPADEEEESVKLADALGCTLDELAGRK